LKKGWDYLFDSIHVKTMRIPSFFWGSTNDFNAISPHLLQNTEPLPILVRIDDDDEESPVAGGDWTMLHHNAGGLTVQPNPPEAIVIDSPSTGIYPSINVPIQRQHQIYHPGERFVGFGMAPRRLVETCVAGLDSVM
jgi:hypothetical protein